MRQEAFQQLQKQLDCYEQHRGQLSILRHAIWVWLQRELTPMLKMHVALVKQKKRKQKKENK